MSKTIFDFSLHRLLAFFIGAYRYVSKPEILIRGDGFTAELTIKNCTADMASVSNQSGQI